MAALLDAAQRELYTMRATFYRFRSGDPIPSENGLSDPGFESAAVYSNVPCYRKSTRDLTKVTPAGRGTQDNMDTADELHVPMQMEDGTPIVIMGNMRVQITDSENDGSNPDDGTWFLTTGQGNPKPWRAKKQIVLIRYDLTRKTLSG
jgi:hypothetical protein